MSMTVLVGERITLREPRPSDTAYLRRYGRSPEIASGYGVVLAERQEITEEEAEAGYRNMSRDPYRWAIELEGRLIGYIGLHHLERHDERAMLRVGMFDDTVLGQGHGAAAVRLVARHAFEEIGLHRIGLRVLASNARAIRCYEKCGFKHEGRERESARTDNGWEDDIVMGLLPSDLPS